jgi:predicted ester cyclase
MPAHDNKELVRRFYEEVWHKGNVEVADDVFAQDYTRHDLRATQAAPGPEGQKQIARAFRAAFPDLRFEVEILIADGDYVAARWTAEGTHTGRWGDVDGNRPLRDPLRRECLSLRERTRRRDLESPR